MIEKAMRCLDKERLGCIRVKDIVDCYDAIANKEFKEGKKTREEIIRDFLYNFEDVKSGEVGYVTKKEFTDFY